MNRSNRKKSKARPKAAPVQPLSLQERLQRARAEAESKSDLGDQTWVALPATIDDDEFSESPTIKLARQAQTASGIFLEGDAAEMRREIARMKEKREGHDTP